MHFAAIYQLEKRIVVEMQFGASVEGYTHERDSGPLVSELCAP
jgi:hypothetical protein